MHFELVDTDHEKIVENRKSYYFWGLTPLKEVDVLQSCPAGAAAIREERRVSDYLLSLLTLGVWSLRTSWYYCLPEIPEDSIQ